MIKSDKPSADPAGVALVEIWESSVPVWRAGEGLAAPGPSQLLVAPGLDRRLLDDLAVLAESSGMLEGRAGVLARRAGLLSNSSRLRCRVAKARSGHGLEGGAACGAFPVGPLAARFGAIARVGATVKHDAAHRAVHSASRHDGMLQVSVTLRTLGSRFSR